LKRYSADDDEGGLVADDVAMSSKKVKTT